jgi:hypothetical protein
MKVPFKKRNDPPAAIGADTRKVLELIGYDESKISDQAQNKIVAIGVDTRVRRARL